MLRFSLLGSGSSGNAILVATPDTKILVDCGLSYKQLRLRAADVGESLDDLKAVFITHEHGDHVRGLGVLARQLHVPVYMTEATWDALPASVGKIPRRAFFEAGDEISLNGLSLESFGISHDAADPVNFSVVYNGTKLGLAGDMGHVSNLVRMKLAASHALVVESNYCPRMLQAGPYPPSIQQRIRGRQGHLSNQDACSLLASLLHDALKMIVLVHISDENNTPDLARGMATRALGAANVQLHLARKDRPTPMFSIEI